MSKQQIETLRADAVFLRHYLENYIVSVQTKDERGYVVNSFAAVQIPDWAVRQRLDDIDAAIIESSIDNSVPKCPTCGEKSTYQTPDGAYWCRSAHRWKDIAQPKCDESLSSLNGGKSQ